MKWELLLIEDEESLLELLAELLTEDDISVTTASNGQEGLALMKERHFDVVVSDISMPIMDGATMFFEAKAAGINYPHIFFSAHVGPELSEDLKLAGAYAVVPKPYFEKLSAEINSIFARKELLLRENFIPFVKSCMNEAVM